MVTTVAAGGPAAQAGIQVGDVIQGLNRAAVKGQGFETQIAALKPGTKVVITYMRSAWVRETLVTVGKGADK